MINIFRRYNPLNAVWLVLMLFVLRVGYIYTAPPTTSLNLVEPFARGLVPLSYEHMLTPGLSLFLAAVLVFAQALLINFMVNRYNLLSKPSFLPAIMYVVISGLFTPFLVLSQPLICNFLVIWMLFKLFDLYKGEDGKSTAFDVGMIVALGTLIYFPFIYLFLLIWIALIIFKPFDWREWVAGITGYATIFFFLAVFYYLHNQLSQFYSIWLPLGARFLKPVTINYYNYLILLPVILILALCFVKLRQNFFKSYVQIRKSFQLLAFCLIIGAVSFYVAAQFNLSHFLLCAVPAAIFFAYYFLYASVKWFYESLFLLLLISIIYFQFNTF